MNSSTTARERYQARLEETLQIRKRLAERNSLFVVIRTALFLISAVLLASGYLVVNDTSWLVIAGWCFAALFLIAITIHEHLRLSDVSATRKSRLYERMLARLDRRWKDFAPIQVPGNVRSALADDLDLFGTGSLWHLLALPSTGFGRATLFHWLLNIPSPTDWQARQAAVRELSELSAEREDILDRIASISDGQEDATELANWASGPGWLPSHRVAHGLSMIGPACVIAGMLCLIVLSSLRTSNQPLAWTGLSLLAAGFGINMLLTLGWGSWMHGIFVKVTGANRDAQQLSIIFDDIAKLPGTSAKVTRWRTLAGEGDQCAVSGFRQLLWCVRLANLQRDPLLYIVYLVLQLTFAWDFRVMESLERWQVRFGNAASSWFDALGECEAVIASATLADEYPDWCYPSTNMPSGIALHATGMGHLLLPDSQRVTNDVTLATNKPLLLVTGSNMAGKSTLLRSLGLNQVLARCGSPVCATAFESPLFELATSIRVRDSLQEGVSFFMAELKRLKEVVELAKQFRDSPGPSVLFLLDEILQGTNSRERQIAVMKVVDRLLSYGAVGAISTHDLEMADQPDILRVSQVVHFREFFESVDGREQMRFDYRMRPGPTPTTNALKLLAIVGLEDD